MPQIHTPQTASARPTCERLCKATAHHLSTLRVRGGVRLVVTRLLDAHQLAMQRFGDGSLSGVVLCMLLSSLRFAPITVASVDGADGRRTAGASRRMAGGGESRAPITTSWGEAAARRPRLCFAAYSRQSARRLTLGTRVWLVRGSLVIGEAGRGLPAFAK